MLVTEIVEQLMPRMQRLGLVDSATGFVDADEVQTYVMAALRYLANRYQLQHFLHMNRELFRTVVGVESYALPPSYGFWSPEETRRSGFAISARDGTNPTNLYYYDPASFNLLRSTTTGKPAWFTFVQHMMYLQPIPDTIYTIEALERPTQDGNTVPDPYVQAVEIETLWRMASDLGRATGVLADERTQVLRTLVNGESRQRQRFYTSYERGGLSRQGRR
jgi:hypothetical protein